MHEKTLRRFTIESVSRLGFVLVLSTLCASPAPAATIEIFGWTKIETNHFTIISQVSDDVGRQVGADLERLHHTLAFLTGGTESASPAPNYFYIFRDEASMAPFRQPVSRQAKQPFDDMTIIGGSAPNAGYLVPHEHGNYAVVVGADAFVPTRYIYKQYLHQRLRQEHGYLPYWLAQGIAEYYSAFKTEDDFALLGLPSEEHLHWIRNRRGLLPADQLMAMDAADVAVLSPLEQQDFFRQSWLTYHYLVNREDGRRGQVARLVDALSTGATPWQAFEKTYEMSPTALETELEAYLAKGTLTYVKVKVDKLDLLIVKFNQLETHAAAFHLGDLLAKAVKDGDALAEDLFAEALELERTFGPAWRGLGELARAAGDHEAALGYFEKAVSHGSDDYLSQFLYGKALLRSLEGRRPADEAGEQVLAHSIDALRASVEREDGFGEAWSELAYAYGLQAEASDESVAAIRRAIDFFPDRGDLALNLVLAHARRGERDEADAVFEQMKASGAEANAVERARETLLQMDYRDAAQLVREGRSEEAIDLFARIRAETRVPALVETIDRQLEKLSIAGDYEAYFELYNRAAEAINRADKAAARPLLDELTALAKAPWQKRQVDKLEKALAQY